MTDWLETLIARRCRIFPMVAAAKRPACAHGVHDATDDVTKWREWFKRPGIVPALATGTPCNIAVVDIDRQHGGAKWWRENRDYLPPTWTWRTRSGGLHLAFQHRPDIRTTAIGQISDGVEIRATGASAIYWPAAGFPVLSAVDPAPFPTWLLPPPKPAWRPPTAPVWDRDQSRMRKYAQGALFSAIERVAGAAPGTRNDALNRETFALLRLTETGALSAAEIAEAMAHAGIAAGLDRAEIEQTLYSAMTARARAR